MLTFWFQCSIFLILLEKCFVDAPVCRKIDKLTSDTPFIQKFKFPLECYSKVSNLKYKVLCLKDVC